MNPVLRIEKIFSDSLDNEYETEWAEEAVFGVPQGTIEKLFLELDSNDLWSQFLELAKLKRGQWLVDIIDFIPDSLNQKTEVLVKLMKLASDEHSKIIFMQEADEWNWNISNKHLIPDVIKMVEKYKVQVSEGSNDIMNETFEFVIDALKKIFNQIEDLESK